MEQEREHHIKLLRELVNYLNLHHLNPFHPIDESGSKSLSEMKVDLAPWSHNYFGNLLLPEFQRILDSFIEINSPHTQQMGGKAHYMKALEFAYAREIRALQLCYDGDEQSTDSGSKTMTNTEHTFLLKHTPPLTNKDDIQKFINKLMKDQNSGKKTISGKIVSNTEFKELELGEGKEMLKHIIQKISPAIMKITKTEKNKKDVPVKNKSIEEKVSKVIKKIKSKNSDSKDDAHSATIIGTRQKLKEMSDVLSKSLPILGTSSTTAESILGELYQQITDKEKQMLDNLKLLHQKHKRFMKPIQLWKKGGFYQVYLFWINLTLSKKMPQMKSEVTSFNDYYSDADDATFAILLGQPQSDLLHKIEFQTNHAAKDILKQIQEKSSMLISEEDVQDAYQSPPEVEYNDLHEYWKSYLHQVTEWKYNYKFLSIKLFLSLVKNKLLSLNTPYSSSPPFLETAFGMYTTNSSKQDQPLLLPNERDNRYAVICKTISAGLEVTQSAEKNKIKKSWINDVKWEPYWNLFAVLPHDHPLFKILLPPPPPVTSTKKKEILSPPPIPLNNQLLNLKTKERLFQWWLHRPFSNRDIQDHWISS